ncbi:hypothetical protein [Planctopirus ephydatiae]|nr:hypothetical protein [Planctopirus ephydatiae]
MMFIGIQRKDPSFLPWNTFACLLSMIFSVVLSGCGSNEFRATQPESRLTVDQPLNLSASAATTPQGADSHTSTKPRLWQNVGDALVIEADIPEDGDYALVLDGTVGNAKLELKSTLGEITRKTHPEPQCACNYLGRFPAKAGVQPVRIVLGWMDPQAAPSAARQEQSSHQTPEETAPRFTDLRQLRLVKLAGSEASGPPAPLGFTCHMGYPDQMKRAPKFVDRIAEVGSPAVEFAIGIQCELDDNQRVQRWGLRFHQPPDWKKDILKPLEGQTAADFQTWMKTAFARAVEKQLEIAILLHANTSGPVYVWRNDFDFDPLVPCENQAYVDVGPLAVVQALNESVPPDWPVRFSITGEMGTTITRYPQAWITVIERLRAASKLNNLQLGIGLNHTSNRGKVPYSDAQGAELAKLWQACDFLGVSFYKDLDIPATPEDFLGHLIYLDSEMRALGAPLPLNKPLVVTEFGVGGSGMLDGGKVVHPAEKVEHIARTPWAMTTKISENPWTNSEYTAYRRQVHDAFLRFLADQKSPWKIPVAYLWAMGSCDPVGIENLGFEDPEVARIIRAHNQKIAEKPAKTEQSASTDE